MKRLLLIFLLLAIPFQMSWAAAGNYCQHEEGKAAQHFGHHAHPHHTSSDSKQSKSKLGVSDADCGYCHLSWANLVSTHQFQLTFPKYSTIVESPLLSYRSHIPDRLARPNWRRVI